MFKKIEIWILYLVILLGILFAIGFGLLVRQELVGSIKAGWVSKTALAIVELPARLRMTFSEMEVSDRFTNLSGFNGTPNSEKSYLLLSKYDGNLNEGTVELVDLTSFKVLHVWNPDIDSFNNLVKNKKVYRLG